MYRCMSLTRCKDPVSAELSGMPQHIGIVILHSTSVYSDLCGDRQCRGERCLKTFLSYFLVKRYALRENIPLE